MTELYPTRACDEFNHVLSELREAGLYGPDRLPQVAEVNEYIKSKTGELLTRMVMEEKTRELTSLSWEERLHRDVETNTCPVCMWKRVHCSTENSILSNTTLMAEHSACADTTATPPVRARSSLDRDTAIDVPR